MTSLTQESINNYIAEFKKDVMDRVSDRNLCVAMVCDNSVSSDLAEYELEIFT